MALAGSLTDLDDFKLIFDLPEEDPADDRFIERMLVLASSLAETFCQRTFSYSASLIERHNGGDPFLYVRRPPIDPEVTVTMTVDPSGTNQPVSPADFYVEPKLGRLTPLRGIGADWSWPYLYGGGVFDRYAHRQGYGVSSTPRFPATTLQVAYGGGFKAIPEPVQMAVCIAVNGWWYARRNDPEAGSATMAGHSRVKQAGVGSLPDDALRLLEPYRITQIAYVGPPR